jgi:hypothetical protein
VRARKLRGDAEWHVRCILDRFERSPSSTRLRNLALRKECHPMSTRAWYPFFLTPVVFGVVACAHENDTREGNGAQTPGYSAGDLAPDGVPPDPDHSPYGDDSVIPEEPGEAEPIVPPGSRQPDTDTELSPQTRPQAEGVGGTGGIGGGGTGGRPVPAVG